MSARRPCSICKTPMRVELVGEGALAVALTMCTKCDVRQCPKGHYVLSLHASRCPTCKVDLRWGR